MKKVISLIVALALIFSFCITASAAGNATLNGNTSVTAGSNVELTLNVNGCADATAVAVSVSFDSDFELVSGTWLKSGSLSTFDTSTKKGALGGLTSSNVNGDVFKLVLKAKTASATAKNVSIKFIAKNGSNEIMNVTPSKSLQINCSTHKYGSYTNKDANHTRTCSVCGHVETAAHTWNSGSVTKAATCKETGIKHFTCNACNATKDETIAKTNNHTWGNLNITKQPTCTTPGTTTKTCSVCGEILETADVDMIPHTYVDTVIPPTPTSQGYTIHKCSVCDHQYIDSYTDYVEENPAQIVVESKRAVSGDRFTVDVIIKNNPGFTYLELTSTYSSKLTLVSVENGELISDLTQGRQYIWVADNDIHDDGLLMTFTFTTSENAEPGSYEVGFIVRSCVNYDEQNVDISVETGVIEIVDFIYGDANGDREINGQDIVRIKKYLANYDYDTETSTIEINEGADANGDGVISGQDVVRLKKYLANYDYETDTSTIVLGPKS